MKRYFCNFIDVLCLLSCGIFACIVTDTVPDQVLDAMTRNLWIALGVSAFLLLAIPRLTKMVWNVVFFLTGVVLYAELMDWATQGVVVPLPVRDLVEPFSIPALWAGGEYYAMGSFALLWALGALCCLGFWRVTLTSLGCYAVWLLMSLGLHVAGQYWLGMENPPLADTQTLLVQCPWLTAVIPAVFVAMYGTLMSLYDACSLPWPSKKAADGADLNPAPQQPATPAPAKAAPIAKPTATSPIKPAAAKKPVLNPVLAAAAVASKKEEPKPEVKPEEKAEPAPEPKTEVKAEGKPEEKSEPAPEPKAE